MSKYFIKVYHQRFNTATGEVEGFIHVANVTSTQEFDNDKVALEYAWRWTNNIEGSWSKNSDFEFDGEKVENNDYNACVKVMQPNEKIAGVEYGQRSSMVGDVFMIGKKQFEVATCGFKEL